jgi:hypothetical protein
MIAGGVVVLVIGAALATLTVEPLRAHLWASVGTSCGTVAIQDGRTYPIEGGESNELCLQRAAQKCQAATLDYVHGGLDTSDTLTVVIEPTVLDIAQCGVAALWENDVDAGLIKRSGMESCANLALQADGLHVNGCGSLGDIVIPS